MPASRGRNPYIAWTASWSAATTGASGGVGGGAWAFSMGEISTTTPKLPSISSARQRIVSRTFSRRKEVRSRQEGVLPQGWHAAVTLTADRLEAEPEHAFFRNLDEIPLRIARVRDD